MIHYAELDIRINEGWPAYEDALKANGKIYEAYVYPGVNHGFHKDSTPRYATMLVFPQCSALLVRKIARRDGIDVHAPCHPLAGEKTGQPCDAALGL